MREVTVSQAIFSLSHRYGFETEEIDMSKCQDQQEVSFSLAQRLTTHKT
jgi:hypothetical protein